MRKLIVRHTDYREYLRVLDEQWYRSQTNYSDCATFACGFLSGVGGQMTPESCV